MGRRRRVTLMVVLVLFLALASCANLGPKGDYLTARMWLGDQAIALADHRDKLPIEEQKKMNAVVVPVLKASKIALDAWGLALAGGQDPTAQFAAWQNVLAQVNHLVTTYLGD